MEFKMAGDQNLVGLAFIKFVGGWDIWGLAHL